MKEYLNKNTVKNDEKIAMVCHSKLIAAVTATGVANEKLEGYYWMNNCEIQPFEL
jgi:hypothetical protein